MRIPLALSLLVLAPTVASAHAVGFGVWRLEQSEGDRWRSTLRVDGADRAPIDLTVEGCSVESMERSADGPRVELHGELGCPDGPGPSFSLDGLPDHMRVQVVVVPAIGPERSFLLSDRQPTHRVESAEGGVGLRYLTLGAVHILIGWDHVAFVLALLLLLAADRRGWRRIVSTLSAFTVGHSVTLGLAAMGWFVLSPSLTEAMIAASLVLLATELAGDDRFGRTWTRRAPEGVALFFGLFHGLGFAGVLDEIGLPPAHATLALFAFNGGVELGQIAVAVAALLLAKLVGERLGDPKRLRRVAGYALGCVGVFVTLERLFG